MDELTRRLRDADPLARDPGLSDFEAAVMRQRVTLTPREAETLHVASWKAAVAAATIAAVAIAGTIFDSRAARTLDRASSSQAAEGTATIRVVAPTTQLQFQTPGGTRIVWTINPDLDF